MKNLMLRHLYPDLPETATTVAEYKNFYKYLEGLVEDGRDLGNNSDPAFLNMLLKQKVSNPLLSGNIPAVYVGGLS